MKARLAIGPIPSDRFWIGFFGEPNVVLKLEPEIAEYKIVQLPNLVNTIVLETEYKRIFFFKIWFSILIDLLPFATKKNIKKVNKLKSEFIKMMGNFNGVFCFFLVTLAQTIWKCSLKHGHTKACRVCPISFAFSSPKNAKIPPNRKFSKKFLWELLLSNLDIDVWCYCSIDWKGHSKTLVVFFEMWIPWVLGFRIKRNSGNDGKF